MRLDQEKPDKKKEKKKKTDGNMDGVDEQDEKKGKKLRNMKELLINRKERKKWIRKNNGFYPICTLQFVLYGEENGRKNNFYEGNHVISLTECKEQMSL